MEEETQGSCPEVNGSGEQSVGIELRIEMAEPGQRVFEFEVPFPMKLVELEWGYHTGPIAVKAVRAGGEDITGWIEAWAGVPLGVSVLKGNVFAAGDRISFICGSTEAHASLALTLRILTRSFTPGFDSSVVDFPYDGDEGIGAENPSPPTEAPPVIHELPFHVNGLEITAGHLERAGKALAAVEAFADAHGEGALSIEERSMLLALLGLAAAMEADESAPLPSIKAGEAYAKAIRSADILREAAVEDGFPLLQARPTEEEWGEIRAFLVEVADLKPRNIAGGLTISDSLRRARSGLQEHQITLATVRNVYNIQREYALDNVLAVLGFMSGLEVMIAMANKGTHAMKRRAFEMVLEHLSALRTKGQHGLSQLAKGVNPFNVQIELMESLRESHQSDSARRLHELQAENKHLRAGFARLGHHAEDVITASRAREEGIPAMEDYEKTLGVGKPSPF